MKINQGIPGLYGPQTQKNQYPRIEQRDMTADKYAELNPVGRELTNESHFSLKKVLSAREVNSLQVLFGYEQNLQQQLYGTNRIRNVNAGMLLDVRG